MGVSLRWISMLALSAALLVPVLTPAPASAGVEEIFVREVYAGGTHNDSYVVLQASVAGQHQVTGSTLTAYGLSGGVIGSGTFQKDATNSESQMTLLIADTAYPTSLVPSPPTQDLTMPGLNLNPAGGAVCWESFDCVAWGEFGGETPSPTGQAALAMTPSQRYVISRDIDRGCPGALDADDDSDVSSEDFSQRIPNPRNNASQIQEIVCSAPSAAIDLKPPAQTDQTSAEFTFHSIPAGAELECRLRGQVFGSCASGSKSYQLLPEGFHQFQVRARNSPDPAGNPASFRWEVDLTAPTTLIEKPPDNPNPGPAVTFYFAASEEATFECSLTPIGQPDDYEACLTQETYPEVADGLHEFRVRATDNVGHLGAPDTFALKVDSTLLDRIPPDTAITSHPLGPVEGTDASFTYVSSEPGSIFQCRLDDGVFEFCPASGVAYDHLGIGPHVFEVRARDEKANVDPTPAGFAFSVTAAQTFTVPQQPRVADTLLISSPRATTRDRTPTLRFSSTVPGASFRCQLDGKQFKRCDSPLTTKPLAYGRHRFRVRAVWAGVADDTPAVCSFEVVRGRAGHRR